MLRLLDLLDNPDWFSAGLLIALLLLIGQRMVLNQPACHAWGLRLAALAFVGYGVYGCLNAETPGAGQLLGVAFRAVLAGGLSLGLSWILLPVITFVYSHTLGAFLRKMRDWSATLRLRVAQRAQRRREEEERRRIAAEEARQEPLRAQLKLEEEARRREELAAKKRREEARAQCEMLYALHAPEIGSRMPQAVFNDFVRRYLGDQHPPEYVEQRAEQLKQTIEQHREKVAPPPKFRNLEELARWFEQQKLQIEAVSDGKLRRALMITLRDQYTELSTKMLEEMQP